MKLLPEKPTEEVIAVLIDRETPHSVRRSIDNTCYELVTQTNSDWREVITEDRTIERYHTEEKAYEAKDRLDAEYLYARLFATAPRDVTKPLVEALQRIERWFDEFPDTGQKWGDGSPVSYGAAFGSNGERDYMRAVARQALAEYAQASEALTVVEATDLGEVMDYSFSSSDEQMAVVWQPRDLRDRMQHKCVEWGVYWRASDAHGIQVNVEQATELLADAVGVEVEITCQQEAPAHGQPVVDVLRMRVIAEHLAQAGKPELAQELCDMSAALTGATP